MYLFTREDPIWFCKNIFELFRAVWTSQSYISSLSWTFILDSYVNCTGCALESLWIIWKSSWRLVNFALVQQSPRILALFLSGIVECKIARLMAIKGKKVFGKSITFFHVDFLFICYIEVTQNFVHNTNLICSNEQNS